MKHEAQDSELHEFVYLMLLWNAKLILRTQHDQDILEVLADSPSPKTLSRPILTDMVEILSRMELSF